MTDEQKAAAEALRKSIAGKPEPTTEFVAGKLRQTVPLALNSAADVLAVIGLVSGQDATTRDLESGCREAARGKNAAEVEVAIDVRHLKHLLAKAGGD